MVIRQKRLHSRNRDEKFRGFCDLGGLGGLRDVGVRAGSLRGSRLFKAWVSE